jgi:hypothetical protein
MNKTSDADSDRMRVLEKVSLKLCIAPGEASAGMRRLPGAGAALTSNRRPESSFVIRHSSFQTGIARPKTTRKT